MRRIYFIRYVFLMNLFLDVVVYIRLSVAFKSDAERAERGEQSYKAYREKAVDEPETVAELAHKPGSDKHADAVNRLENAHKARSFCFTDIFYRQPHQHREQRTLADAVKRLHGKQSLKTLQQRDG